MFKRGLFNTNWEFNAVSCQITKSDERCDLGLEPKKDRARKARLHFAILSCFKTRKDLARDSELFGLAV